MYYLLRLVTVISLVLAPATVAYAQDAAVPAPAPAAAPTSGAVQPATVSGSFTLDGEEIAVTHACALRLDNEEGVMDGPELRILLADREVTPDLLKSLDLAELSDAARKGEIKCLLLRMDLSSEERKIIGAALAPTADAPKPPAFFTLAGGDPGVTDLNLTDERVSVAVKHATEAPAADAPAPGAPPAPTCAFEVKVDTQIASNDPITAHMIGDEATGSPQATALIAFEDAVRNADLDAMKKVAYGQQLAMIEAIISQVGADAFKQRVAQTVPDAEARRSQVSDVYVRGSRAVVVLSVEEQRAPVMLVQKDGAWLVK